LNCDNDIEYKNEYDIHLLGIIIIMRMKLMRITS